MLNFLTPPTDSFYKFIGISGLVLFIVCGVFLFSGMYKDDYKLTFAKGEVSIQEARLMAIVNDLEYSPQYKDLENVNIPKLKAWVTRMTETSYSSDSLFIQSFYALPDSVRKKIQTISFLYREKQLKHKVLSEQINGKKDIEYIVLGCWLIGEIFGVFGIWLWYEKLQKPLNEERKNQEAQKRFSGTDLATDCHSCYMAFYFNSERGTEKDGTMSRFFCKTCYEEGKYLEPDLTFDEAKKRLRAKLQELNYKRSLIKKNEKEFGKLLRWERLKTW